MKSSAYACSIDAMRSSPPCSHHQQTTSRVPDRREESRSPRHQEEAKSWQDPGDGRACEWCALPVPRCGEGGGVRCHGVSGEGVAYDTVSSRLLALAAPQLRDHHSPRLLPEGNVSHY